MKQILFTFIALCCSFQVVSAQTEGITQYDINRTISDKVLDLGKLRITYSLFYIADSLKPEKVWEDRKILLIGDSIQQFYSDYQRSKDSVATAARKKGKAFRPLSFDEDIEPEG